MKKLLFIAFIAITGVAQAKYYSDKICLEVKKDEKKDEKK